MATTTTVKDDDSGDSGDDVNEYDKIRNTNHGTDIAKNNNNSNGCNKFVMKYTHI